jgi:hypothetical protein
MVDKAAEACYSGDDWRSLHVVQQQAAAAPAAGTGSPLFTITNAALQLS